MVQVNQSVPEGITALLSARPEAQVELLQTLSGLARELRSQSGCTACMVAQDVGGGPRFLLHISWVSQPAMHEGIRSEAYRVLLGALSTLAEPLPAGGLPGTSS